MTAVSQIHRHFVFVMFALVVNPLIGWSHPGHGASAQAAAELGPVHYLIEPVHSLPIVAAIAILLLAAALVWRVRSAARPASPVER